MMIGFSALATAAAASSTASGAAYVALTLLTDPSSSPCSGASMTSVGNDRNTGATGGVVTSLKARCRAVRTSSGRRTSYAHFVKGRAIAARSAARIGS